MEKAQNTGRLEDDSGLGLIHLPPNLPQTSKKQLETILAIPLVSQYLLGFLDTGGVVTELVLTSRTCRDLSLAGIQTLGTSGDINILPWRRLTKRIELCHGTIQVFSATRLSLDHLVIQLQGVEESGFRPRKINLARVETANETLMPVFLRAGTPLQQCCAELSLNESCVKIWDETMGDVWETLSHLEIIQANLQTMIVSPSMAERLVHLSLASNPMSKFPDSLLECVNLSFLDLSRTSIDALPEVIGTSKLASSLTTLKLCHCTGIQAIPESISNLGLLRTLDMKGCNRVLELPENFGPPMLVVANFTQCGLRSFPINVTLRSPNLKVCKLIYNALDLQVPADIKALASKTKSGRQPQTRVFATLASNEF